MHRVGENSWASGIAASQAGEGARAGRRATQPWGRRAGTAARGTLRLCRPPRWAPLLQALPRPPPSGGMFASLLLVKRPSNAHRDAQRQPAATAEMCGARPLRAWHRPETDDGTGAEPKTRHVPEVFSKNIINVQNCNLTGAPLLAKISDSRPRQPRTLNVGLEILAVRDGARARRVALPPSPAPSPFPPSLTCRPNKYLLDLMCISFSEMYLSLGLNKLSGRKWKGD